MGSRVVKRRKHYKVHDLPKEIVETVNRKLGDGKTYQEIADYLESMGHEMSVMSVHRYAKNWSAVTEQVIQAREQAAVLVQTLKENPNSDLAEAAEQVLLTKLSDILIAGFDDEVKSDPIKLASALAQLQQSGLRREKLKLEFRQFFDKAGASAFGKFYRDLLGYLKEKDDRAYKIVLEHFDGFVEWIKEEYGK